MKFSMIVPTLGERDTEIIRLFDSLEKQTYKNFELIVVTQDNHDKVEEILTRYKFDCRQIRINKKGISMARNEGLKHVTGDILTLTDDDCWYEYNALEVVTKHINRYDSDVSCFKHYDPIKNQSPKLYPKEEIEKLSKINILQQTSFDIYINMTKKGIRNIKFDERFGVGQKYNSGEENIYLMDLYNKGFSKMSYFPITIAYHPIKKNNYLDEKSFIAKGPLFKRLFGNVIGTPAFIVFALKKRNKIENFNTVFKLALKEQLNFKI